MSIKLMPKFRKHAIGAAEPAAPKAKKAAAPEVEVEAEEQPEEVDAE